MKLAEDQSSKPPKSSVRLADVDQGWVRSPKQICRVQAPEEISRKGENNRIVRARRGEATLAQFARKLGISDSTLQRLEIGGQNIGVDTLERTLDRLKCPAAEVFGEHRAVNDLPPRRFEVPRENRCPRLPG